MGSVGFVQASYMKNLFTTLASRGLLDSINERAPDVVKAVIDATRLSWIPLELNVRTVEEVCRLLGEEEGLGTLAECVHAQFETPLWRGFISGAVNLLGLDPGKLGRWMPRAYALLFRGCGAWTVEVPHRGELHVHVEDLPETVAGHRLWLRSIAIGIRALLLLCKAEGTTELAEFDPRKRTARFVLTWEAKPAAGGL